MADVNYSNGMYSSKIFSFLFLYTHTYINQASAQNGVDSHVWKRDVWNGNLMVQSAWRTISNVSLIVCAGYCGQVGQWCDSFSYSRRLKLCHLSPQLTVGSDTTGVRHFYKAGAITGINQEDTTEFSNTIDDTTALSNTITTEGSSGSSPNCSGLTGYVGIPNGDSCIKVFVNSEHSVQWGVARDICQNESAELLRIDDTVKTENLLDVLTQLQQNGIEYWVGATDSVTEGVFYWHGIIQNSDAVLNVLFQNGEPDDGAGGPKEDCLLLTPDMKLSDRPCQAQQFFICEAPPSSTVSN